MIGYGYGFAFGAGIQRYKPYINYTWSMLPNGQVKNNGTSGTNLQLYSGNPLDFQGSQYISETWNNLGYTGIKTQFSIYCGIYSVGNNTLFSSGYASSNAGLDIAFISSQQIRVSCNNATDGYLYVDYNNSPFWVTFDNGLISVIDDSGVLGTKQLSISSLAFESNQSLNIASYRGMYSYYDGLLDGFVFYKDIPTPTQISQGYSNPNAFYEAMKNDANTLFCTDFRGTAGYIADDKNNLTSDKTDTTTIDISSNVFNISFLQGTKTFLNNEVVLSGATSDDFRFGVFYLSKYTTLPDNTPVFRRIKARSSLGTAYIQANGKTNVINTSSTTIEFWTTTSSVTIGYESYFGMSGEDLIIESIENIYCSAVYPITNYSETMRTNFQQETTGLQDLTRSFDSLGFYTGVTDYLNCNGVGYGDTGWIPSASDDWSIEFIGLFESSSSEQAHGVGYVNPYNRVTFSCNTSGTLFSRCGGTVVSYVSSQFDVINSLTLVYVASSHTFYLYRNGVFIGQYQNLNFTGGEIAFTLGIQGTVYTVNGNVKLFKVHNKVLTQEEITNNYNDYVAQGLLQ